MKFTTDKPPADCHCCLSVYLHERDFYTFFSSAVTDQPKL